VATWLKSSSSKRFTTRAYSKVKVANMLACPKCPLISELRQITKPEKKLPGNSTLSSLRPNDGAELLLAY
jgi:hypothetical protein